MHVTRSLGAITLVVLLGATTVSCAEGEPEPKMPATPTASQSPTEPASKPSPEPAEPWQEKSFAGAEAFATHWFDVFSEAMPTGDTSEMRAISDPECANCNATIETLEGFYEDGGYYRSKGWKVRQATSLKSSPMSTPTVGLSIYRNPAQVKDSVTAKERRETGGTRAFAAKLRWTPDGWLMVLFEPVD